MVLKEDFYIKTNDGWQLSATKYSNRANGPSLIIAPAMGVRRGYYADLAIFFAENGYQVVTFDYRGMGTSFSESDGLLDLADWGRLDIEAVIRWAQEGSSERLFFIGHSVAGQVFPLAPSANSVTAAILICSQTASRHFWTGRQKWMVNLFWYVVLPLSNLLAGRLVAKAYGGKVDIPKSIAQGWAKWGKSERGAPSTELNRQMYDQLKVPTRFISFEDDQMLAPEKATRYLMDSYGSTKKDHIHIFPEDIGRKQVGHFYFFKKEFFEHWSCLMNWFEEVDSVQPGHVAS